MKKIEIENEIKKIKLITNLVLAEDSNDPGSFDFIKLKAAELSLRIHMLKDKISLSMEDDKTFKISFQKLCNSLSKIDNSLSYKMKTKPTKEDIDLTLSCIQSVKSEIEELKA